MENHNENAIIIRVAIRSTLLTILIGMMIESLFKPSWQTVYVLIVLSYVADMFLKN
jgi:hypothetical protein